MSITPASTITSGRPGRRGKGKPARERSTAEFSEIFDTANEDGRLDDRQFLSRRMIRARDCCANSGAIEGKRYPRRCGLRQGRRPWFVNLIRESVPEYDGRHGASAPDRENCGRIPKRRCTRSTARFGGQQVTAHFSRPSHLIGSAPVLKSSSR
jgi:hypothetical protein